jgi:hypothetical protein
MNANNKPVSAATQNLIQKHQHPPTFTGTVSGIDKQWFIGNVDNTSDANKPVSAATKRFR